MPLIVQLLTEAKRVTSQFDPAPDADYLAQADEHTAPRIY